MRPRFRILTHVRLQNPGLHSGNPRQRRVRDNWLITPVSAEGIGSRAARRAGNSPPTNPMIRAYVRPIPSSCGVTWNANATWLNVEKFMVDVW